ncbi:MAG: hypothetical protein RPU34_08165, partial [Candidatus Sedimenticola sp. (ex Thyasira tokunagai)]
PGIVEACTITLPHIAITSAVGAPPSARWNMARLCNVHRGGGAAPTEVMIVAWNRNIVQSWFVFIYGLLFIPSA